jgi:hypothetical protein
MSPKILLIKFSFRLSSLDGNPTRQSFQPAKYYNEVLKVFFLMLTFLNPIPLALGWSQWILYQSRTNVDQCPLWQEATLAWINPGPVGTPQRSLLQKLLDPIF